MAIEVKMPQMSDTQTEGVLVSWLVEEGAMVKAGDIIAQIETDKATMDFEIFDEGILLKKIANEGDTIPVGGLIAVLGSAGEDLSAVSQNGAAATVEPAPAETPSPVVASADVPASVKKVTMPQMSDTQTEGVLVSWLVEEGAKVQAGDIIASIETDKATMDFEVFDDGVLLKKIAQEGETIPVGGLIAVLGNVGDDISALLNGTVATPTVQTAESAPVVQPVVEKASSQSVVEGRVKASPLAKKMAADKGIDLQKVQGSGTEGRIVKKDLENLSASPKPVATAAPAKAVVSTGGYTSTKITPMRATIARRLSESKFSAPHFYLQVDVDMENCIAVREQLNLVTEKQGLTKISFNDIITKVCAVALKQHPAMNSSWLEKENEVRTYDYVHVAIAVALPDGLVTPVIRNADSLTLSQIAAETQSLAKRAKDKQLQPADWEGSTFTTSNLGMFGIERFTAIINPPNAGILAIGGIRDEAVVKNGQVVAGKRMALSLSCDHRVVDGAVGAQFLGTIKQLLENPIGLLV